jgi:hypothetical protein
MTAMFTAESLRVLADSYATLQRRFDALAEAYALYEYRTKPGKEYATHGFLRRFSTMQHCIERVFDLLPPELDELPKQAILMDATVCIQAFVMNVFGALDNLAWIWVSERELGIGKMQVGLGPKYAAVRASVSPEMRDYLTGLAPWFEHIIDFRDALAHRIPLFIPPYIVPDANDRAYGELEVRKFATKDMDEYDRLKAEQLKLVAFHPVMKHSLQDEKPPVVFHFQLLQDFLTVEEIGQKMLEELRRFSC